MVCSSATIIGILPGPVVWAGSLVIYLFSLVRGCRHFWVLA